MYKAKKISLALSVAMVTFSGQSFAVLDGWDFSGDSARNEAMSTDYWNMRDNYNVWVNPAYATKYTNYADVNITDGAQDDEMAGVFAKLSDTSTIGFYIGRPTSFTSSGFNPNFYFFDLQNFGATNDGVTGQAADGNPNIEAPRSQFDLFYANDLGDAGSIGVRFNLQLLDDDFNTPQSAERTPNTLQPTDVTATTDTVHNDSNEFSSSDLNLSIGWTSSDGVFDGAFIYGAPSLSGSASLSDERLVETLNGVDGTVVGRTVNTFVGTSNADDDGTSNIGLVGRGNFDGILTTFSYAVRDSGMKGTLNGVNRSQVDADNDGTNETDTSAVFTRNDSQNNELTEIRLSGSKVYNITPDSNIFASVGLSSLKNEGTLVSVQTADGTTDNLTGTTTYPVTGCTINSFGGTNCLGTHTNNRSETTSLEIPLVISAEGKMSESITVRGSVYKNLYESIETDSSSITYALPTNGADAADNTTPTQTIAVTSNSTSSSRAWDTDTTVALGMGYEQGSFNVDLVILKEFVTQGVDEALTSRINATWMF